MERAEIAEMVVNIVEKFLEPDDGPERETVDEYTEFSDKFNLSDREDRIRFGIMVSAIQIKSKVNFSEREARHWTTVGDCINAVMSKVETC